MGKKAEIRVLGIIGSPRKGGNTDCLVNKVLDGVREAGGLAETVYLNEKQIKPCQACGKCKKEGRCVQEDDMEEIARKMKKSQAWVLGTPVYWWGPTAQFKLMLDRWYGVKKEVFRGKEAILAIPFGAGDKHYARHAIGILEYAVEYLDMNIHKTLLSPGSNKKGIVSEKTELMESARQTGYNIVEKLRV